MRIVGGRLRGRPLAGPKGSGIRPTSDRLRESFFNILAHGYGLPADHTRVLDLFAGTGALGLEAMSRGAAFACFVDDDVEARALIRTNIEKLGLTGATRILRRNAGVLGRAAPIAPFSLVVCDPPYGQGLGERALACAAQGGWLIDAALCVVEERAGETPNLPESFTVLDQRRCGDSQLAFLRYGANAAGPSPGR